MCSRNNSYSHGSSSNNNSGICSTQRHKEHKDDGLYFDATVDAAATIMPVGKKVDTRMMDEGQAQTCKAIDLFGSIACNSTKSWGDWVDEWSGTGEHCFSRFSTPLRLQTLTNLMLQAYTLKRVQWFYYCLSRCSRWRDRLVWTSETNEFNDARPRYSRHLFNAPQHIWSI